MTKCRRTGKLRYRDEAAAHAALKRNRKALYRDRLARRFYECPWCRGWHLTSREELR